MYHWIPLLGLLAVIASWLGGGMAKNILVSNNQYLTKNQYLSISDYYLILREDCNVALYNRSQPVSSTNLTLPAATNCFLIMQTDGNLVLYNGTRSDQKNPLWATDTMDNNPSNHFFILKDDGNYDIYDYRNNTPKTETHLKPILGAAAPALTSANAPVSGSNLSYMFPPDMSWKPTSSLTDFVYMPAEYFLSEGYALKSLNGFYNLTLDYACNLQVYLQLDHGSSIWESGTRSSESRQCQLVLQRDGSLELHNNNTGQVYWKNNKTGDYDVNWVLEVEQNTGNLNVRDLFNSSNILWRNSYGDQNRHNSKTRTLALVLGVIGGVILIGIAVSTIIYFSHATILDPAEKELQCRLEKNRGKCQAFSQAKITQATENFSRKIGHGGFGDVFYGKLEDGKEVAVKVLSPTSHQSKHEFYNEIELLSTVHHKYLVSLVGYCVTSHHQILIYEYLGGGNLQQNLQGHAALKTPLSWKQRTNIILHIAEGLEYLHHKCNPSIIHRDVKTTNILLTNELVAKVADFGISKVRAVNSEGATHITTAVKGTPGYLDPEYYDTGMLTEKSDVYAFGVVLMEILTGQHQTYIVDRVSEAWKLKRLADLADPNLDEDFDRDEFLNLVELSLWCVRKLSSERPSMPQVILTLQECGLARAGSMHPEVILVDEEEDSTRMDTDFEDDGEDTIALFSPLEMTNFNSDSALLPGMSGVLSTRTIAIIEMTSIK